ncbi:MAG: response regulator [Candidatus Moraniibacteriota bacterium]
MMRPAPFIKKKVCVIDDDDNIREIYQVSLKGADFEVVTAADGEQGLVVIKNERPDIILLDLQMPIMDGFEVLKKLDKDPELSRIPVVILSNVDDEMAFKKAGKFDTRFYMIKALTSPQKVIETISEVLN